MKKFFLPRAALSLAFALAFAGCLKPEPGPTGVDPSLDSEDPSAGLDARHGGARIALPEIDFAALAKVGADSSLDTATRAYLELTITGADMAAMSFRFPLRPGSRTFEIRGIPSGAKRAFSGRLLTRDFLPTHEGTTVADIKAGVFSDVRLYLAKAKGGANVCLVIEGQKLPACAQDTLPPPPPSGSCWHVTSDSVSGNMSLYPRSVDGYMGVILTTEGKRLPVTTWSRSGDSLSVIVVRPSMDKKWILSGPVIDSLVWRASVMGGPMESPFPLYGKAIPCGDTVVVPPKDTLKAGAIPSASSSAGEVTLCFEMRFDYADRCGLMGYAKMSFFAGRITRGYVLVADRPARAYETTRGYYDQSPDRIRIETFLPISADTGVAVADTLVLDGLISSDRTMVKGEYMRLPAEKKGVWTMTAVTCGSWTSKYPDSTCFTPRPTPLPVATTENPAGD